MFNWLFTRYLRKFERRYDYDASYMHFMLAADPHGFRLFVKATALGQYKGNVPAAPLFAAKIVSSMGEDCGPCTQVGVRIAEEAGIAPAILRAVIAGDIAAMPREVALTYRFALATLAHDPAADELRDEIRELWGDRGLVTLSLAILSGRLYPTVKYALGYGKTCQRVTVGTESVVPSGRPTLRQVA